MSRSLREFKTIYLLILTSCVMGISDRYVFKIDGDIDKIGRQLSDFDFRDIKTITPNVYSFKYTGSLTATKIQTVLVEIKQQLGDKIIEIEPARVYTKLIPFESTDVTTVETIHGHFLPLKSRPKNVESENYFGMHVEDAWNKGFNGSGIIIAVTDVGINENIDDLRRNLNMDMARNFMDDNNTQDITPEEVETNYKAESIRYIDHGNRCASIIAAEKGNDLCSAGIAYDAKVVPLKIFSLLFHRKFMFKLHTTSDAMAAALAYRLDEIHIFSNSWCPQTKFGPLGLALREAILHGTITGRNKLGAIYVVPDGSDGITGSGIANSINTITVNSVGVGGTLPRRPEVSACVITSGLSDGNKLHTNQIMTSSYNNACIRSFKGVSAAVAEVSAIIALILQARPNLTIRDVQIILAESSDREGLEQMYEFNLNAAGKYFHAVLGFGLLNADKAVTKAQKWRRVGKLYNSPLSYLKNYTNLVGRYPAKVVISVIEFKMGEDLYHPHVNTIEHVVLRTRYDVINRKGVRIEIVSPSNTASVVVDNTEFRNMDEDTSPRNLTSVHFLGESPIGRWKVRIQLDRRIDMHNLIAATSLTVYGTFNETKRNEIIKGTSSTTEPDSDVVVGFTMDNGKANYDGYTIHSESSETKNKKESSASQKTLNHVVIYAAIVLIIKLLK